MKKTIKVEALVKKIVSICDDIEELNDGDKKKAESLKNELDIYVDIIGDYAKNTTESYYKVLSDLNNKTGWSEALCAAHAIAHTTEYPEYPESPQTPETPEDYHLCTKDTGRKINEVGANIILEMKENLKEKCKQTWTTYTSFKNIKGVDDLMAQKYLTKWLTYQDLYKEFFGEEV